MRRLPLLLIALALPACSGCADLKGTLVEWFTPTYEAEPLPPTPTPTPTPTLTPSPTPPPYRSAGAAIAPTFDGPDAPRAKLSVTLVPVGPTFREPTDVQFVPGQPALAIVLEKGGAARWLDVTTGESGLFLQLEVLTRSEEGLLGLAFHPDFAKNGRFFTSSVQGSQRDELSRIESFRVEPGADLRTARPTRGASILAQQQPYPNHNGGQLAFGPDGKLYVGFGDGGFRDDPHDNGQATHQWLGKLLRIDVDAPGVPYAVPPDNPFVGRPGWAPEIWALGLRNPWRFSFDGAGRLWVADVGQNLWEEIDVVPRGGNLGWRAREGRHCFPPGEACSSAGFVDPVYEYDREDGRSITGGFVYEGAELPALKGRYLFADFLSGRLWAITPPGVTDGSAPLAEVSALGRFGILPSTFGRDATGELWVADFGAGRLYRIAAAP